MPGVMVGRPQEVSITRPARPRADLATPALAHAQEVFLAAELTFRMPERLLSTLATHDYLIIAIRDIRPRRATIFAANVSTAAT